MIYHQQKMTTAHILLRPRDAGYHHTLLSYINIENKRLRQNIY